MVALRVVAPIALALITVSSAGLTAGWLFARFDAREGFAREADRLAMVLEIQPGATVGDVRAGTGVWSVDFARRVGPEGLVYATPGPQPAHVLLGTVAAAALDNITVITRAPGSQSRLPPQCCDAVLLRFVYNGLRRDRPTFVNTLHHNVKPGGRVAIVDLPGGQLGPTSAERLQPNAIIDEMTRAGFTLRDQIQPWFGNTFCLVFERPRE